MAGEAVPSSPVTKLTPSGQFASLMATAAQSSSETARKLARLQALQQSESTRRKENDLADKEREKHDRWNRVLENHEKQVRSATQPEKSVPKANVVPPKPKILQPVRSLWKGINAQGRSMTFKKLLKEAAKVDPATFKVGPKLKSQPRIPEKPRVIEKSKQPQIKQPLPTRTIPVKPSSPHPKSILERAVSSSSTTSRSVSPLPTKQPIRKQPMKSTVSAKPVTMNKTGSGKDAKSRLRESFVADELIPLAQGPKRDLRTIEEIQNDLWRKKGKSYPSVTGKVKEPTRKPVPRPVAKAQPLPAKKMVSQPIKRQRESESPSEDSFIASSSEEEREKPSNFDYRAEIRAIFNRKGPGNARVIDSEDDSDMEATGIEMAREEARAAKLARMEDEEEERRLEERAREKKRRKLEAERKKRG